MWIYTQSDELWPDYTIEPAPANDQFAYEVPDAVVEQYQTARQAFLNARRDLRAFFKDENF